MATTPKASEPAAWMEAIIDDGVIDSILDVDEDRRDVENHKYEDTTIFPVWLGPPIQRGDPTPLATVVPEGALDPATVEACCVAICPMCAGHDDYTPAPHTRKSQGMPLYVHDCKSDDSVRQCSAGDIRNLTKGEDDGPDGETS